MRRREGAAPSNAFDRKRSRGLLPWLLWLPCVGFAAAAGCGLPRTHLAATKPAGGGGKPDASMAGCIEANVDVTKPADTVVLLVERSSAMNTLNDSTCASCGTYFTALARAVDTLTTATSNRLRWGLKMFPSPGDSTGCLVTPTLDVPPAEDAHADIAAALAAAAPGGGAPVTAAVRATSTYLNGVQGGAQTLIMLATAGAPTCAANDPAQDDLSAAVAAVNMAPQFAFVLGLGPQRARLDKLADVGSTGSSYTVDQASSLLRDIEDLANQISCVYPLPDGALGDRSIAVLIDGMALTPDAADAGFSVAADQTSLILRGSACRTLLSHASLVIRVGCDG